MEGKKQRVLFSESEGLISGEYAYLYPPGIPLLTPGEKIDRQFLEQALLRPFLLQSLKKRELQEV